jgi:NAD(P)-dependent dehydrogenase (short-subunit alcohol dehydrogenase family)
VGRQVLRYDAAMSEHELRRCLVTGGSSGIGRAAAARLLADGWAVTSLSRRPLAPDGVEAVAGDAADPADIERALETAAPEGRLHGLVCSAGVPPSGPWDDEAHWEQVLRVDLTAAWQAFRVAWPALRAASGSVVLLGSIVGSGEGSLRSPAYAAAKAGIEGLARSLALIGAKQGVRVNVLAPGAFDTPFDEQLFPPRDRPDVPLGRMGAPEEAAGIIAFLLGDEASYVNGSVWRVDGGRTVLSPTSSAGVAAPEEHTES